MAPRSERIYYVTILDQFTNFGALPLHPDLSFLYCLLKIISAPPNLSIFPMPVYSLIVSFCTCLLLVYLQECHYDRCSLNHSKNLCRTLTLMAVERLTQFFVRTGEKNSSSLLKLIRHHSSIKAWFPL